MPPVSLASEHAAILGYRDNARERAKRAGYIRGLSAISRHSAQAYPMARKVKAFAFIKIVLAPSWALPSDAAKS
jgi:hypothetical protein